MRYKIIFNPCQTTMSAPHAMLQEAKTMSIPQVAPWMFSRLVTLKRYPNAEELLELFNLFFASCVQLKHLFFIKEGIYRIRGICMNTNDFTLLNSICDTLVDVIQVNEPSAVASEQVSPVQLHSIPFLSTNTMDSKVKFKWDTIRLVLDLLKFKNHSVYIKAFEFCVAHKKTREGLKLSYDILRNKQPLMQLGYQPYFELQLAHLSALYKLNLTQQALGVASDIINTLLNSNDGFGGISLKLFAKEMLQDQMQQQDISTLVTNEYIVKHPLFDLLCQFYATLANDPVLGPFSNYKLFLNLQFKNLYTEKKQDLKPIVLDIILSLLSCAHVDQRGRQAIWPFLGYSSPPTVNDLLKRLLSHHSEYLTTETTSLINIHLNAPPHKIVSQLVQILKTLPTEVVANKMDNLRKSCYVMVIKGLCQFYSSIPYAKLLKMLNFEQPNPEFELDAVLLSGNSKGIFNIKIDKCLGILYLQDTRVSLVSDAFDKLSHFSNLFNVTPMVLNDSEFGTRYRYQKQMLDAYKVSILTDLVNNSIGAVDALSTGNKLTKKIDEFRNKRSVLEKEARKQQDAQHQEALNKVKTEKQEKDDQIQKLKEAEIEQLNQQNLEKEQKVNIQKQLAASGVGITQIILDSKVYKNNSAFAQLSKTQVELVRDYEVKRLNEEQSAYVGKFAKQVDYLERAMRYENGIYKNKNAQQLEEQSKLRATEKEQSVKERNALIAAKKHRIAEIKQKKEKAINHKKQQLEQYFKTKEHELKVQFDVEQSELVKIALQTLKDNLQRAKQEMAELKQKELDRSTEPRTGQTEMVDIDRADQDTDWRRGQQPVRQERDPSPARDAWREREPAPIVQTDAWREKTPATVQAPAPSVPTPGKYVPPTSGGAKYVPPAFGATAPTPGKYVPPTRASNVPPPASSGKYAPPSRFGNAPPPSTSAGKYVPPSRLGATMPPPTAATQPKPTSQWGEKKVGEDWQTVRKNNK